MPDLSGLPAPLARLVQKLLDAVVDLTAQLERSEITAFDWQRDMEKLLTRYHEAAYMTGQDSPEIDDKAAAIIVTDIEFQLGFLDAFATTIAGTASWQTTWNARAAMYAEAIGGTYWKGRAAAIGVPTLPAYPGSATCLSHCRCSWDIKTLDKEAGDYDAYWRRGASAKSCKACMARAEMWSPLKIRGGKIA